MRRIRHVAQVESSSRPEDAFGVAVVRAWIERGPPQVLKVRVSTAPDLGSAPKTVGVTSSIDEACALIRDWLDRMVSAGSER